MSSAVELERDIDRTDVPYIVRGAVKIGLITAIAVLMYSLVSRFTNGVVESALKVFIIAAGTWLVTFLPGQWTRARTIEGIAGAAGIGLAGTVVYLLIDVTLLQNIGTYTEPVAPDRWRFQLVVPPRVVDGRHLPPLDGRLHDREPGAGVASRCPRPRRS